MGRRGTDHERNYNKMTMMAKVEEYDQKMKQGKINEQSKEEKSCLNCSNKRTCKKIQTKFTTSSGSASIGSEDNIDIKICEKYKPSDNYAHNPKKVKSLLKLAMKGRL